MKKFGYTLLIILSFTGLILAQDSVVLSPDVLKELNATKAQVSDLQQNLQAANSQIQALIQRAQNQPVTAEAIKSQRQIYVEACKKQGMKFKSLDIDAKTGDITLHCS